MNQIADKMPYLSGHCKNSCIHIQERMTIVRSFSFRHISGKNFHIDPSSKLLTDRQDWSQIEI